MEENYLYSTAVPILLDGRRLAGRVARMLYTRYGLESHWFGSGWHWPLAVYARRHAALPFTEENDPVTLRLLTAFAKERGASVGIPALIPCSPEAQAFLERVRPALEEDFVLLGMPVPTQNPIRGLVRKG